jgi:hypothetical protein
MKRVKKAVDSAIGTSPTRNQKTIGKQISPTLLKKFLSMRKSTTESNSNVAKKTVNPPSPIVQDVQSSGSIPDASIQPPLPQTTPQKAGNLGVTTPQTVGNFCVQVVGAKIISVINGEFAGWVDGDHRQHSSGSILSYSPTDKMFVLDTTNANESLLKHGTEKELKSLHPSKFFRFRIGSRNNGKNNYVSFDGSFVDADDQPWIGGNSINLACFTPDADILALTPGDFVVFFRPNYKEEINPKTDKLMHRVVFGASKIPDPGNNNYWIVKQRVIFRDELPGVPLHF